MVTDLYYQTSHGPMTLEEIRDSSIDPMFYVKASRHGNVHPDRRDTLNMDHPTEIDILRDIEWGDVEFNNGEHYRLPIYQPMIFRLKDWSGGYNYATGSVYEVCMDNRQSDWEVVYFSRVRRSGKYCQIRHSGMPAQARLWEHRFVYAQWHRKDITGLEVHHIDENPYNNCPENLQTLTRVEHAKHTATNQKTRHTTRSLQGKFIAGGGPGRVATVPQPMPERLKTINNHQYLKIVKYKSLGKLDIPWMDMKFVDPDAGFVVNSFFFC